MIKTDSNRTLLDGTKRNGFILGGNTVKVAKLLMIMILLFVFSAGCAAAEQDGESNSETIYTTIYPLQFLVDRISGGTIEAISVYPPGVDEHTYEPTAKEIAEIANGDAFLYIGAGLEALATTVANALDNQDVELIEIGKHEEIFSSGEHHHHDENDDLHHPGDIDAHIWLDPLAMIEMAHIIKDALIELYPDKRDVFEENLVHLEEELQTLHDEYAELLHGKENKKLLVTHAAFGYWEERYGIEQVAIHGLSTENEPSQKELIEIIETANEHQMGYIIFEQNVATRTAEVIQEEIGAEPLILHNLAVLTEEDLAEKRDYLSIMRDNLKVLDTALD